jgi:uncharacterized protein
MTSTSASGEPRPELLEPIDEAGCYRLLGAGRVGRLAVVLDGRPHLVVLNYLLAGHTLLFRTRDDAVLARLTGDGLALQAEFEVDSAFAPAAAGWSVIASGLVVLERDPGRVAAARSGLHPWAEGERDTVLRLDVARVSGRRVGAQ